MVHTASAQRRFGKGLARAFGGALIFALPMMMTMEMWQLGFYIDPWRLALLLVLLIPLLVGLGRFAGFQEVFRWQDEVLDAFVAFAVGVIAPALVLYLFAVIDWSMSANEIIGKVALQAVPGSIGANLAESQLGGERAEQKQQNAGYFGELFVMAVGALFLAFNVAPTEEMVLIAYKMTEWHAIALVLVSILIMHAFVYSVEFHGQEAIPSGASLLSVFLRFTVAGYALVLLISLYMLWTFGRLEGLALEQILMTAVVLSFPAALGAAAARLIL